MKIKYNSDLPLDSPERTLQHKEIILQKKFLKKLYEEWYGEFKKEVENLPEGKIIELGAGGGFLKQVIPEIICSDILDLPTNDMTFSALKMPFDDGEIAGIFMVDTLHHIPDMEKFFREAERVLAVNGKVIMIEPANTLWGRFIYKNFHHEPFDPTGKWTIPSTGPLSGANGALPWIVFERDRNRFAELFPHLHTEAIRFINPFLYLLSGGVSYRQLLPDFTYPAVRFMDHLLPRISKQFSMFQVITITKDHK
jgi:SAM-dependent methyltransferase